MNILILQGGPNKNGSTAMLAEGFTRGATAAGHRVERLDVAHADIRPCAGCLRCGYEGPCAQRDDMREIKEKTLAADMLVFATPLYYYGMTAQLKTLIDRFCFFNGSLHRKHLKSALLTVAWNDQDWTFDALTAHYKTLVRYLDLQDCGMVLGYGCGTPAMTRASGCVERAEALGRSL